MLSSTIDTKQNSKLNVSLHSLSFVTLAIVLLSILSPCYAQSPPIQLATQFREKIDIKQYYVSEKLDGIRGYWDGNKLISKRGTPFTAPSWFTKGFPAEPLDGELWVGRQQFEKVSGIVRTQDDNNQDWKLVKFMLFDLPNSKAPFSQRVQQMEKLVKESPNPYLGVIEQKKINSIKALQTLLDFTVKNKGEGLMLHHEDALYRVKRNQDLMKLKKFEDAEAKVLAYLPGKGKYKGMLGSILVETEKGVKFKIGSGFSDEERKNPPAIGSTITYKFTGKTINGIPKFASFMRIRVLY